MVFPQTATNGPLNQYELVFFAQQQLQQLTPKPNAVREWSVSLNENNVKNELEKLQEQNKKTYLSTTERDIRHLNIYVLITQLIGNHSNLSFNL